MKTFIKQNWFKFGILVVILVIGVVYFSNYNNYKNSDMEVVALKEKCLEDGNNYVSKNFPENKLVAEEYSMNVSTRFIYSPDLKTCLADISRITSPQHWYYAIIDIYTDHEIASYSLDKTDKESWTSSAFKDNYEKYNTAKNKYFSQ